MISVNSPQIKVRKRHTFSGIPCEMTQAVERVEGKWCSEDRLFSHLDPLW